MDDESQHDKEDNKHTLDKMLDHDAFTVHLSFKKKQKLIYFALGICAILVSAIILFSLCIMAYQVYKGSAADPNISSILSTSLWILTLFASTVFSATVFNSIQDMGSLRSSMLELVSKLK